MVTSRAQAVEGTPAPAAEPASGDGFDPGGISRLRQVEIESGPGAALVAESRNLTYTAEFVNRAGGGAVYAETRNDRGDYGHAAVVAVTGGNNALLCRNEGDVACAYVENRGSGYGVFAAGDRPYGRADSIRLKHDLRPLTGALATIGKLAGVRFTWNRSGRRDVGFVAEHVARHLPEAVTLERDGSSSGMSYDTIVPLLVEAVKELDARPGAGTGGAAGEVTRQDLDALRDQLGAEIEKLRAEWQGAQAAKVTPELLQSSLAALRDQFYAEIEELGAALRDEWTVALEALGRTCRPGTPPVLYGTLAVHKPAGVPERCLELDGEDDGVDCGDVLPAPYTLAAWVLEVGRQGAPGVAASGEAPPATVRWSFVAVNYDPSGKTLRLYRDGLRVAEARNAALRDGSDRSLRLGRGELGVFRGRLAAISIWNRVLPPDEILALQDQAPAKSAPGLVEFYPGDVIEQDAATRWIAGLRGGKATLHGDVRGVESGSAIAAPPGGPITVQLLTRPVRPEHCLEFAAAGDRLDCGDVLGGSHTRTAWTFDTVAGASGGRWTFLAATYDQGQKTLRFYRDGRQTAEVRNAPLRQGFSPALSLGGGAFRGRIGAASVWNRVLSPTEVLSLMEAAPLASAPGLVEYWPLDALREDGGRWQAAGARGRAATASGQVRRVKSAAPTAVDAAAGAPPELRTALLVETVEAQRILNEEQKGRLDRLEAELATVRAELDRLGSGR